MDRTEKDADEASRWARGQLNVTVPWDALALVERRTKGSASIVDEQDDFAKFSRLAKVAVGRVGVAEIEGLRDGNRNLLVVPGRQQRFANVECNVRLLFS